MKILNTTDKNRCNCVKYLRSRLAELPYSLWTLEDKEAITNSKTPVIGSGAMCADGIWFDHEGKKVFSGHVALVTGIKDDIITIQEANYKSCTVTEREGTKDKLKIVGFFVPERLIIEEETMENHEVTEIMKVAKDILDIDAGTRINKREDGEIAEAIKDLEENYDNKLELYARAETENTKLQTSIDTLRLTSAEEKRELKDKITSLKQEIEDNIEDAQDVVVKPTVSYHLKSAWNILVEKYEDIINKAK